MNEYQELKNRIIKELFKNEEYAEFLCNQDLTDPSMIDMICAAPISLKRKAEILKELSAYQGEAEQTLSFKTYYDEAQKAIDGLTLNEGEIFLCLGKTRKYGDETQLEAFPSRSLAHIYSIVNEDINEKSFNSDDWCDWGVYCDWYELEKWHTATKEDAKFEYVRTDMVKGKSYTYTFVNGEICYFDNFLERFYHRKEYRIKEKFNLFYSGSSLNLPTPWKEGDILEVDGTPFAPKVRVVVLNSRNENDCCFPCCMYLTEKGVDAGALTHSHIYENAPYDNISPLYSVKRFTGELTADEKVLKIVADYVKDNRERGDKIFELITQEFKGDKDADYDAMRKQALIEYILHPQKKRREMS